MVGDLPRRLLAEAAGTGLLLAVVIGSGIMAERLSGGNAAIALLANTLATVGGLYVLIEVFGPVSGAHFNPAVSAVMAARGTLPRAELVPYIAAQLAGAMLGETSGQDDGSVNGANHLERRDRLRRPGQPVAAIGPRQRLQQPDFGQLLQNFGQQRQRNPVAVGDRLGAGGHASRIHGEVLQRDQTIVRLFGQFQH